MNVLLVTFGSSGDVHPYVGISLALQARGHQVTFVTNRQHVGLLERCRIPVIALPNPKELPCPRDGLLQRCYLQLLGLVARRCLKWTRRSTVLPMVRPVYEIIAEQCARRPSVVVAHYPVLGARVAQDHLGIPTITSYIAPACGLRSNLEPPSAPPLMNPASNSSRKNQRIYRLADRFIFDPALAGTVNRLRQELGLAPCERIIGDWRNSPDCILGLFPDWFAPPPPDWPKSLRLTGFPLYDEKDVHPLPVELERFLDASDPPIIFTATSDAKKAKDYFGEAVQATQRLGRRAVLFTKHPKQLPARLPAPFLHVPYAPFSQVLQRAAALVHFCGIGSAAQALAAGTPQLLIPQKHDQHDTALRFERLGVARGIWHDRKRTQQIIEGLDQLLHSSTVRANCHRIAERIDPIQTMNQICSVIEELEPRVIRRAA